MHQGHLETDCPICPRLGKPEYRQVKEYLVNCLSAPSASGDSDEDWPDVPAIQVKTISAGIGDALMAMAIGCGLHSQFPASQLVVVAPRKHHPWLNLFEGFRAIDKPRKGPLCYCEHDVGTPSFRAFQGKGMARWDYWATEFGTKPFIPAARPLPASILREVVSYGGRVVLSPFARYEERTWPLERWLEVEQRLLDLGFRCVVLSETLVRTDLFKSPKFAGQPPANIAALLNVATHVVGNDSGMAHLAGMLKRPTTAICSYASDANIFGMYPTVSSLGGRTIGFESVTPEQVVESVTTKIKANLGMFPADSFADIVLDLDRWRIPGWQDVYATLWRTVKEIAPRRIVEIGTRAGYSAWVMLDACPDATLVGIDADFGGDLVVTHGGFKGACEHAKEILPPDRFRLQIADSHCLEKLPDADLAYVDGDHTPAGCLADMYLVQRSGIKKMLVDDTQFDGVREAIGQFLGENPAWSCEFIPSDTGLAKLTRP